MWARSFGPSCRFGVYCRRAKPGARLAATLQQSSERLNQLLFPHVVPAGNAFTAGKLGKVLRRLGPEIIERNQNRILPLNKVPLMRSCTRPAPNSTRDDPSPIQNPSGSQASLPCRQTASRDRSPVDPALTNQLRLAVLDHRFPTPGSQIICPVGSTPVARSLPAHH